MVPQSGKVNSRTLRVERLWSMLCVLDSSGRASNNGEGSRTAVATAERGGANLFPPVLGPTLSKKGMYLYTPWSLI